MNGGRWIGFLCGLLLALTWEGRAQKPFHLDFFLNEYKEPVAVRDIATDGQGYHWLATDQGVYRFNGQQFTKIEADPHSLPRSITVFQDRIWVGYHDGTLRSLKANRMEPVFFRAGKPQSPIHALHNLDDRFLLMGTQSDGLVVFWEGLGFTLSTDRGLPDPFVYGVAASSASPWLIPTDKGISQVSMGEEGLSISHFSTADSLRDNIVRVLKPLGKGSDFFWVGTHAAGVAVLELSARKFYNFSSSQVWDGGQVNDILPMEDGRAWVATEKGEMKELFFDGSQIQLGQSIELEDSKIYRLLKGRSGLIWAATNKGLRPLTIEYLAYYPLPPPFRLAGLSAMAVDHRDRLWLAQDQQVYFIDRHGAEDPIRMEKRLAFPSEVTDLYFDEAGHLWVGTFGSGLFYCRLDKEASPYVIPWFEGETILAIQGKGDRIWVSSLNGVKEMRRTSLPPYLAMVRRFHKSAGLGSDYVYDIFLDGKQQLWLATDGAGVVRYDSSGFRHWGTQDGFEGKVVYQVLEDPWQQIWVVCLNKGLYRYGGDSWQGLGTADGLQDINISTIGATGTGEMVVVHEKGIDVWYPRSGQFRNYARHRSLGIDSLSTTLHLFARDRQGKVLIPFQKGLLEFRPIADYVDISPRVSITSRSVFFEEVLPVQQRFAHDQNHISFQFDGIFFANADRLRYRYKLEGYNQDWVVTNDPMVTFPKLDPGSYRFRVQASANQSFRSQHEAAWSFVIDKPFWAKSWFIVLASMGIIMAIIALIRYRENQILKLSTLQRDRMRFEYENLKSQVNPHFLFNSLNTLSNLIDEDREAAQHYTSHLSDLYRNMLSFRSQDTIPLREEWEILQNYLFIQKVRFGEALNMEVDIPQEVMDERRIVPLALQMLVENAIKHNVVSARQPLTISLFIEGSWIVVKNPLRPKINPQQGAGLGLANIASRYRLLTDREIHFGLVDQAYIVKLPLL